VPSELLLALYRGDAGAAEELRATRGELDVFEAAALGEVDELRRAIAADPAAVHAWSDDGFTPLHYAAFFGRPEAARLLVDAGADLEAPSRNDEFAKDARPLHSAAAGGERGVCRVLLEAGADPNATQHGGFTPLRQAEQNDDAELVELLRQHGAMS
jgi:uncharacterized protein